VNILLDAGIQTISWKSLCNVAVTMTLILKYHTRKYSYPCMHLIIGHSWMDIQKADLQVKPTSVPTHCYILHKK